MTEGTIKTVSRPAGIPAKNEGGGLLKKLIGIIVIIAIAFALIYWFAGAIEAGVHNYPKNTWQAVFLTNGQVYFGHVAKVTEKSVVLEDIYYLQVVTRPLQTSQDADTAQAQQQEERLTLIKLGNEIHGPYDRMNINRSQVVLIENLKDDSNVVTAITDYITKQTAEAAE